MTTCRVDGCSRPEAQSGLCSSHFYSQAWIGSSALGDATSPESTELASPSLPTPLHLLYVIGLFASLCSVVAIVWAINELGSAASTFVGAMAGAAVGSFVPALATHAIVMTLREARS